MTITNISLTDSESTPKYKQIADAIADKIESGELTSNDKLPTHRALADSIGVTVGTVTRAYSEIERRGLVEARVGAGTFVVDKQKVYWAFDQQDDNGECNFGFNIPPLLDRSDMIKNALDAVTSSPQALNQFMLYQKPTGIDSHREIIAGWLTLNGLNIDSKQMLFTSGAQHGVQMVLDAFTRAGDTILVEKLTYPGLISLARQKQLSIKGVEMDVEGITPQALDAACRQNQARFIYLTPTLQNPTTAIMSLERRQAILDVCKKHNLIVLEDDVNGLLPIERPPALVNLAPEQVIHIGAVSKCLAPGLRVGYLHAPKMYYQQLSIALQNHSWMVSPLLTALTCELVQSKQYDLIVNEIRKEMAERLALALEYLSEFSPRYQTSCYHMWLTLPEQWRLTDFVTQAKRCGVIVKSAELFTPPAGHIIPAVRLALSSPINQQQMKIGLVKLRELLQSTPISDFDL